MKTYNIDLKLFDTQTTVLNTTGNDLSPEMRTYYSDYLIDNATPNLVHDQFGQKHPIPKNGGKTIEFRKYSSLAKSLTPITEGVTPSGNKLNVTTIEATIAQYGDYIEISDILQLSAIDNNLVQATQLLGDQAGRTLDTITREILNGGTNVIYAPSIAADGTQTAVTSRTLITDMCKLTVDLVMRAATQLKAMNSKPCEGGSFVAIVHPYIAYDLMKDDRWTEWNKYTTSEKMFNGELGKIANVRFVESTEAKIWESAGASVAGGGGKYSVYSTLVLGNNAYGITEIAGGGLQNIVKQLGSSGTSDPLNQRATSGWKAIKVAERLVEEYMVRIESGCTYATAKGN